MNARLLAKLALFTALFLAVPWVRAQDGVQGALPRANLTSNLARPFQQTLAVADFDGDKKPDGAVLINGSLLLHDSGVRKIELHFTGRANTDLSFESNQTDLAISALDVNRDGAADIVVEQSFTHKRIQVWLNDGRGGFRKVRSEDNVVDLATHERAESPSQQPDNSAICLPSQRDSETAILTAWELPHAPPSSCGRALGFRPRIIALALATIPSRGPPLTLAF
ncbi:MAG TPA: VCBS repeat-containing protein [Terriglobales bacterium]|nr:VCBS repeat-containing protein [Terriglobales bacterium]